MPELPEVEVTRRSFASAIEQATIQRVWQGLPLRWPLGCAPEYLVGQRVGSVQRRGKYLLLELSHGWLLVHLGMSGSLLFSAHLPAPTAHEHFDLVTTRGVLRLNDPRRFGAVVFVPDLAAPTAVKLLGKLGMEPLSDQFDLDAFAVGLKKRRTAIKQVLLAGNLVVGVGNIYACESLFLAGIRPTTVAARLRRPRVQRLRAAIIEVLTAAIERGGSTLRDFSSADGSAGHFQLEAKVYGRAGLPCLCCGSTVRVMRQGQRSSYFCPVCQKA
ncbi:MAG: DNA-formamidopyrimidine glycosylase [Comamonadaceae bacterium CG1_02_60_18]|nr:MAG: DNA-formamidopyrimidine glycosylase [Comamonadaceae bacterium CG1_02_60_18]PIQ53708.1 MAG: formamidopyrimidine-DNA glycosylase [Comamonadaceae bacterium CG12_big_fil_rev_8_21_14_0_65_59_15]